MANSIVFQSSADQLKSAIFGYDSTTKSYQALNVNSDGELMANVGTIGTINKLVNVGTLAKVTAVGTVAKLGTVGTLTKVSGVGTIDKLGIVGTVAKVTDVGTITKLGTVGTLTKVSGIGTIDKLGIVGTVAKVTGVGTITKLGTVGTLTAVAGTVKINLSDRAFSSTFTTVEVGATNSTYTKEFDISKYQDTSWYVRNVTSQNREAVTIQLAATPSTDLTDYPRVLIQQTATVNDEPKIITNEYSMKYVYIKVSNPSANTQTVRIVFNGRY